MSNNRKINGKTNRKNPMNKMEVKIKKPLINK